MNKANIKDRLRKALELREITQSELAEKANIDKGQLSSYLSGKYKPRQNNIDALATALNVNEAWLMGFDVPMERIIASDTITLYNVHCETEQEAGLILTYRKLNSPNQKKCSTYAQKLLSTQELEDEVGLLAAHDRTDVPQTPEGLKHDLDLMNDPKYWE